MKKIAVVCAPGIGDALIFHIASHHLTLAGYKVSTITPHDFGRWLPKEDDMDCDAIFLQHDNSQRAKEIHAINKPIYTFYGSHNEQKHGPLKEGFDYVCDQSHTMVENVQEALKKLFNINATKENGIVPPKEVIHRLHKKRVIIHATSSSNEKNWPYPKFIKLAAWLNSEGYEPSFLPLFPTLDQLFAYIYESGFFIGNDSGPGHIASCLEIPNLIIGKSKKQMLFWRPGWPNNEVIYPPNWCSKILKINWNNLITVNSVIKTLTNRTLIK